MVLHTKEMKISKWRPPSDWWESMHYDDRLSNRKIAPTNAKDVVVRPHYLESGEKGSRNYPPQYGEMERWIPLIKSMTGMVKGIYWFYRNGRPTDLQFIVIHIVVKGNKLPAQQKYTVDKPTIVFDTISNKRAKQPNASFLDMWETGIKASWAGTLQRKTKRRGKDPPNPFRTGDK